ncbi:MAG: chromosomal replication initiator DnaA [Fuscovulum sp.]|nr:chromosomal replication initiator DnaA [Fuscovulum sp.]
MSRQLAFDLPARDEMTRAAFFVSPVNALALAAVDGWRDWPGGKMLLVGPSGSGKTHLAHLWAAETGASLIAAADLAGADLPALAAADRVAVEDADALAGDRAAETALFHLHNLVLPAGRLLMTATRPPRDWGLVLPDLMSRMQAAPVTRLEPPDDALLSAVLVKLFADRQIAVAPNLIPYLVARMPRSIGAARGLVAALDARALAEGRPITRALAAEILDSAGDE